MAKVFYSWMSDGDPALNKHFIWDCLERAIKQLNHDGMIEPVEAQRDVTGARGMVDIVAEIFRRIDGCDLIIADVTNVNPTADGELVPNPNVMFEFGYALARKGEKSLIGVANIANGAPERLPFDINKRLILKYELRDRADRARVRPELVRALADAIRTNLGEQQGARALRQSEGMAALMGILIFETDLRSITAGPKLAKHVSEMLDLARIVSSGLHDEMDNGFAAMLGKAAGKLDALSKVAPVEENFAHLREGLMSALYDVNLGSRWFMQSFALDSAGLATMLDAVRQLPKWFDDAAKRFGARDGSQVPAEEIGAYELKTWELRRASLLSLLPSHPQFAEQLRPLSVEIRAALIEGLCEKSTDAAVFARIARDAAARLDALLCAYPAQPSE